MSDIKAFLEYKNAELADLAFDANPSLKNIEGKPDLSGASLSVEVTRGLNIEVKGDDLDCICNLGVSFEIRVRADSDDAAADSEGGVLAATGRCTMYGGATCAFDEDGGELQKKVLAANTISYLWGKIRDWIELVSMASFAGKFVLPAIDPYALVEEVNDAQDTD